MQGIALRRIDSGRNMARFYTIGVQPTLFGDWAVVRGWGRIGTYGRTQETWFSEPAPALACADGFERAKRRRGYRAAEC